MAKSAAMKVLKASMKASQTSMKAVKAMKATQKTSSSPMKSQKTQPSPMKSMKVLPSSPMKSMKVKKDSGNKDKNKDKGAKGKKLSLEEKIQLWREKNKDAASDAEEEPDLSHEEWQKVNGRFKTAMNKNQTAKDAWENASNLSKGNVQKAKRQAMVAWLMDPSFGKGFQQYIQTVSYDQRHTTTEKPETFKQLLERYDEEEIEAMVDAWYSFSTFFVLTSFETCNFIFIYMSVLLE